MSATLLSIRPSDGANYWQADSINKAPSVTKLAAKQLITRLFFPWLDGSQSQVQAAPERQV